MTDWDELLALHVVRKLAKIINRRWNLGMGFHSRKALPSLSKPAQGTWKTVI